MRGEDQGTSENALAILIIEDMPADYLLVERFLRKDGLLKHSMRVDTTEGLDDALQSKWDVVLSDYNVPGMDVAASLTIIRAKFPDLPVILVSGSIGEELAVELLHLGFHDFILKERLARLPSAIRRAVAETEERRARRLAENELRKLAWAVEQSPDSIMITDTEGRIEYVNAAFEQTTGFQACEVIGENPRILNKGDTPAETYAALWQTLLCGEVWKGEFINARRDGTRYLESAIIAPLRQPDGTISNYVAIKQDVTEQRRTEQLVQRLAYHDALTDLPNRAQFREQLEAGLAECKRDEVFGALMVLNIERFQFINDTMGYETGDRLLREYALRILQTVEVGDSVARIGGDEFAAIFIALGDDPEAAETLALERARAVHICLNKSYAVGQSDSSNLRRNVRIGLCLFGPNDDSVDPVWKRAEVALRAAREERNTPISLFSVEMQASVDRRADLEAGLQAALERKEFSLYLQPQFDCENRLIGAEALLRWFRGGSMMIGPSDFIPLAEDTGLIVPIGQWVITEACALLKDWQANAATRHLRLAVNVSARQFHQPDFVARLATQIQDSGIDPSGLELELTETVILADLGYTLERMNEIRQIGVRLSLDDFGMGYSSLGYLKHLPFHQLKIDQSFVRDMILDQRSANIVAAILAFAHALGLEVVAEGVETTEQQNRLKSAGCQLYQGYLLGRPLPLSDWQQRWCG